MALSEQEEEIFKQLEGTFTTREVKGKKITWVGFALAAVGVILLVAGTVVPVIILGVAGYVLMLAGAYLVLTTPVGDRVAGKVNGRIQRSANERAAARRSA